MGGYRTLKVNVNSEVLAYIAYIAEANNVSKTRVINDMLSLAKSQIEQISLGANTVSYENQFNRYYTDRTYSFSSEIIARYCKGK